MLHSVAQGLLALAVAIVLHYENSSYFRTMATEWVLLRCSKKCTGNLLGESLQSWRQLGHEKFGDYAFSNACKLFHTLQPSESLTIGMVTLRLG